MSANPTRKAKRRRGQRKTDPSIDAVPSSLLPLAVVAAILDKQARAKRAKQRADIITEQRKAEELFARARRTLKDAKRAVENFLKNSERSETVVRTVPKTEDHAMPNTGHQSA